MMYTTLKVILLIKLMKMMTGRYSQELVDLKLPSTFGAQLKN